MIDLWSGLGGTLIGAAGGTFLGYGLSLKHEQKSNEQRARAQSEALAHQILNTVAADIDCIRVVKKIANDVGTPPHIPTTRNVFYPMWQRSRKLDDVPYRDFLQNALALNWDASFLNLLSDSKLGARELAYQIDNLSLTWDDMANINADPSQARDELWQKAGEGLKGNNADLNLGFAESTFLTLWTKVRVTFPEIDKRRRKFEWELRQP